MENVKKREALKTTPLSFAEATGKELSFTEMGKCMRWKSL